MKLSTSIAGTVIAVSNPLPLANLIRRFRLMANLSQLEVVAAHEGGQTVRGVTMTKLNASN